MKKFGWRDNDKDGVINAFDCQPNNFKKQDFVHVYAFGDVNRKNIKTVMIPPKEFLRATFNEGNINAIRNKGYLDVDYDKYIEKNLNRKSIDWHKTAISSKEHNVEIPFLIFDKWGRPVGHEGRNTSQAAAELGMPLIPVTIEQRRHPRDWEKEPSVLEQHSYDKTQAKRLLNSPTSYVKQTVPLRYVYKNPNREKYESMYGPSREEFGYEDNDGDGVINSEDCEPNNPNEQGKFHKKRIYSTHHYMDKQTEEERPTPPWGIIAAKKRQREQQEIRQEESIEEINQRIKKLREQRESEIKEVASRIQTQEHKQAAYEALRISAEKNRQREEQNIQDKAAFRHGVKNILVNKPIAIDLRNKKILSLNEEQAGEVAGELDREIGNIFIKNDAIDILAYKLYGKQSWELTKEEEAHINYLIRQNVR
jgi:hypothetical protein